MVAALWRISGSRAPGLKPGFSKTVDAALKRRSSTVVHGFADVLNCVCHGCFGVACICDGRFMVFAASVFADYCFFLRLTGRLKRLF